jgi:protein-tyrosine-phosphatase
MIARRLERVSDQARNICMEVLYLCTGEYAKHPGAEVFRVLFVDEHNACRSQMAEVLANALNEPKFSFASAGLDPRPIEPATIQFMKAKGHDVARMVPKAITQVPHLDHYHVIVALAPEAHRAFPPAPRKVVFLDWPVPDPSVAQGPAEQVRAAYEETFQFLSAQIRDLVEAILGQKKA